MERHTSIHPYIHPRIAREKVAGRTSGPEKWLAKMAREKWAAGGVPDETRYVVASKNMDQIRKKSY